MKAKYVNNFLNEDIIDTATISIQVDYGIYKTKHSKERQARHEKDYISNEEIKDDIKSAFDDITEELLFDIIDIGQKVLIKNKETNLNIVGQPIKGKDNNIIFKVITVMRTPNFKNKYNTHIIEI